MNKRTTIVLAIANAAVLAFILLFERGSLSTSEVAGRRGQLLTHFIRERVTRVELVRSDEPPIVLARERDEDEELGTWHITAPVATAADDDAVDSFLSALEWLDARRTLDGITAEDRTRFGLDEPRFVVRFTVGNEQVELRVGGDAPTGEGVYAAITEEDRAYVVGTDFIEAVDHDLSHFRDKQLFGSFYATDARSILLSGGGPPVHFEHADGVWNVTTPDAGWANAAIVDRLLRVTRDLRAARFVTDAPDALSEYGLDAPWRELTVTRAADATGQRVGRLRVGAPCGEHTEERYARVGDDGPIACVSFADVQPLEIDRDHLREQRLIAVTDDAIERIEIESGGRRLELRRTDARWELRTGRGELGEATTADGEAIASWLRELRESRARELAPLTGGDPGHGLASPRATLTLDRSDDETSLSVMLGDGDDEGAWVRRGDEEAVARFPATVASLLSASELRFRDRDLVDAEPADARRVETARGDLVERAVRAEGGTWRLEAPVEVEADRVVVRELARQLADLRATRFVDPSPSPSMGLASPRAVVTVRFEPEGTAESAAESAAEPTTVTLRLGAETVDGAYAQLGDDETVFEVTHETVEAVERGLASLDELTIVTEELTALRIERGGETFELTRAGAGWQTATGASPDAERTRALLDRLDTLRATSVLRYGAPEAASGLAAPSVRIVGTRRESASGPRTVTIEIGATVGEGADAIVAARRADLAIVYGLRAELVQVFRDYTP
jgi:hypothetical protein